MTIVDIKCLVLKQLIKSYNYNQLYIYTKNVTFSIRCVCTNTTWPFVQEDCFFFSMWRERWWETVNAMECREAVLLKPAGCVYPCLERSAIFLKTGSMEHLGWTLVSIEYNTFASWRVPLSYVSKCVHVIGEKTLEHCLLFHRFLYIWCPKTRIKI